MSPQSTLVATLAAPPEGDDLARLPPGLGALEVRADLVGDVDPALLRAAFDGLLIYTLRSAAEGGRAVADPAERGRRLAAAAAGYDLVDLEGAVDLRPELLARIPAEKRLISWHGEADELDELRDRFAALATEPARYYKLVAMAHTCGQSLLPLALLRSLGRDDVIAFAGGELGAWTRLLAPRLGAPLVYAALGAAAAPGQPRVERLTGDYGLPELGRVERIYGIVGNPVGHSLSPRLHNAIYRLLGLPALYLTFQTGSFGDFWLDVVESGSLEVLGFELGGLSVTAPFKEIAQAVAGASSPLAERIGSANTLARHGGVWEAESTDPEGVVEPLRERAYELPGRRAVVVGSGGAGRAAAFGLARGGAAVTLSNRGVGRGRRVARELGLDFTALDALDVRRFDVVVNATPLGRHEAAELPFEVERLAERAVVVDLAYRADRPTRLVERVRAAGRRAIDGREVLLHQALPQFLMMTGRELPIAEGRRVLGLPERPQS